MEAAVANALQGAARVIANERLLAKQLDEDRRHVERCQRANVGRHRRPQREGHQQPAALQP